MSKTVNRIGEREAARRAQFEAARRRFEWAASALAASTGVMVDEKMLADDEMRVVVDYSQEH